MSLESRLRRTAKERGRDLGRTRQLLVFDRFLARVFEHLGDKVIVKGGLTLELRLERARTTKDVDLHMTGDATETLEKLRSLGSMDLGDFLTFVVEPDKDHPTIKGDGMVYDGQRFRCEARLAGKLYGGRFGVDIGFADAMTMPPEVIEGSSFLDFAGARRGKLRIYPRPTHIAEKLHAYTVPRERENSRVKDLPDLALLASVGVLDAQELRDAINATFDFRKTHEVPEQVPAPPESWKSVYERMAAQDNLTWKTIEELTLAVREFLDPVLSGVNSTWDDDQWHWTGN